MTANIDKVRLSHNADVKVDRVLENLVNVRRLEGIIDFYRLNGAPSGEIALAVVEFVKRGDEGLGMVE
jgi:hypothetical protein